MTDEDGAEPKAGVGLGESGYFDRDIYGGGGKFEGYVTSIAANDEVEVRALPIVLSFMVQVLVPTTRRSRTVYIEQKLNYCLHFYVKARPLARCDIIIRSSTL